MNDPRVYESIEWLQRVNKPGLANFIRELSAELYSVKADLEHAEARQKIAEKMYLRECDKSMLSKIFG